MFSNNTYINIISELSINSKGYTKYLKWYVSIIEKAKIRELIGYKEKHHIVPKCLFNSNNKDLNNLLYESWPSSRVPIWSHPLASKISFPEAMNWSPSQSFSS